jgi:Tfp pilus assembly protein PilN
MRPLNLAARPFRNQRLPNALLALAWIALVAMTVVHGVALARLLPSRTSARDREVAALEQESARLRQAAAATPLARADPAEVTQWTLVKDLVDRRAFSWTDLFARLEEVVPDGVRLTSISPSVRKGDMLLDVVAQGRSPDEGWDFVRRLDERTEFSDVFPTSEGEKGEFHYTMRYRPPRPVAEARP